MLIKLMFEGGRLRTQTILGVVWFLAADVCRILEIANVPDAVKHLSPHQVGITDSSHLGTLRPWVESTIGDTDSTFHPGANEPGRLSRRGGMREGNPNANWVTLGGLFRLAFRSRKPAAVRFTDWMADEVAPSLWRHGCYPPPARPVSSSRAQITVRNMMHEEVDRRRASGERLDENEMAAVVAARIAEEHPEVLRGCAAKAAHDVGWHKWVKESEDELPKTDPQQPDLFMRYSVRRDGTEIPLPRKELRKGEIAEQILAPRYRARQASRKGVDTTWRQDRALIDWWNIENPETPFTDEELRLIAQDLVESGTQNDASE